MKSASEKLFCLLAGLLLSLSAIAQTNNSENTFSLHLNIPVIIDEVLKTDYTKPEMEDKLAENLNKRTSVTIRTKPAQLIYFEDKFWGKYKNKYFPYEEVSIYGKVSKSHMNLEYMVVEKLLQTDEKYRNEKEHIRLKFENVPMYNGVCFYDKSVSSLKMYECSYLKTEISPEFKKSTHQKTFLEIDENKIPDSPKLAANKFSIRLKMDGPPSFIIETTTIRGLDPEWKPPVSELTDYNKKPEPNSIGIYRTQLIAGNDSIMDSSMKKGVMALMITWFAKMPGYKVLERAEIDRILQEIKLSENGLVKENSRVKNKLMLEEVAVLPKYDGEHNHYSLTIQSRKGEQKIDVYNVSRDNIWNILGELKPIVEKTANDLLQNK